MIACARSPFAFPIVVCLALSGCGGSTPTPTPTPTAPSAPTNLQATASNGQVSLTWTASSGASSYDVQRSSSNGGLYNPIAPDVTTTSYTDTTVTNGTTYFYDVYAVNSVGASAKPAQASAKPEAPPQAPSNLAALSGDSVVSLTWSPSSGAVSYSVLRSIAADGSFSVIATGVTTASYSDTSVNNGTTYYYVVQAVDNGGPSGNSNQVLATPSGEVQARVTANEQAFYVYKDADSGFNHGFASGWFVYPLSELPNIQNIIQVDSGCVDDPADTTIGCYPATDTSALDTVRGTVLRFSFAPQAPGSYAGVNIEEPEHWGVLQTGTGYYLADVDSITFDVRSPDGAQISFGVGECTAPYTAPLPSTWTTMTISISSLDCQPTLTIAHPELSNVHVLFSVAVNDTHAPNGATVLLDNIRFTPVPARTTQAREGETLSLPQSNQAFGVVAQPSSPFPPDQANRNFAAIYEAALSIQTLINQGDIADSQEVADALDYALYHDNHGDYLSTSPGLQSGCFSGAAATQCGLHDAYFSGDIALFNNQDPSTGIGQAGDGRLAGFSCGTGLTSFCSTQDTATGGNNAWALLALLDEYKASGNVKYLNDAITIGNWIRGLADTTGFGGYFVGYSNGGEAPPKTLNKGKSTENNADIFIAFTSLARYDPNNATMWTAAAKSAGDFVMAMYDPQDGHFYNGTDPASILNTPKPYDTGVCPYGTQDGNDIININSSPDCDFLDSNTFTTLAMAASPQYSNYPLPVGGTMDWRRPIQYVLNTFPSAVSAGGLQYQGFDIIPFPLMATDGTITNGISWEFTGQVVETLRYVDQLYKQTTFETLADEYLKQMQQAQTSSPYGDFQGLVASTLQNGGKLPPVDQCLNTPFDNCPPERVGLAATTWMILAEQQFNPLAGTSGPAPVPAPVALLTPTVTVTPSSTSILSAQTLSVTVAISGGSGNPTPTGTVTLSSGNYISAITSLSGGAATIVVPANSLSAGNVAFTADYTPDVNSSSTYYSATGTSTPVMVTISLATATPVFSPAPGTYSSTQTVTLSDATPGATIYYTTNGTTPTTSSAVNGGTITVSSTEMLEAIAVATAHSPSAAASATYIIAPAFTGPGIESVSAILPQQTQTITITGSGFGTQAAYSGNSNSINFVDSSGVTWSAGFATDLVGLSISSWTDTQIVLAGFTGAYGLAGWSLNPGDSISISVWNAQSAAGPYACTNIVVGAGPTTCGTLPTAATPTFSVAAGTYTSAQTVTISDGTPGDTVYYATNWTTPDRELDQVHRRYHRIVAIDAGSDFNGKLFHKRRGNRGLHPERACQNDTDSNRNVGLIQHHDGAIVDSDGLSPVRLQLMLDRDECKTYEAVLLTVDGKEVFRERTLRNHRLAAAR
jgi:hypothetical protein